VEFRRHHEALHSLGEPLDTFVDRHHSEISRMRSAGASSRCRAS
jgi:hypothetical protein